LRTIYLRKDQDNFIRRVLIDMAYLSADKKIRLPKAYFEEGLYLPFFKNGSKEIDKYYLSKDKIISEDQNHYFFKFPFKPEQVEDAAV